MIRVLLVDPDDDAAVRAAASASADLDSEQRLRARIRASLDELVEIGRGSGGRLLLRVTSTVPTMGVNAIDVDTERGVIVVQHYEYRAPAEPAPILTLHPGDGRWYHHFVAEANRMWEDAQPWPPTSERAVARGPRPAFTAEFGPELMTAMAQARHLLITGVSRNTLINSNYAGFERWLDQGCEVRVLLVDPRSPAIATTSDRYYAHRSSERAKERITHALALLQELASVRRRRLSVRLTTYPISLGLVAVDPTTATRSSSTAVFVEYYSYQVLGEPKFVLSAADGAWCDQFIGEAERLWVNAEPVRWDTG